MDNANVMKIEIYCDLGFVVPYVTGALGSWSNDNSILKEVLGYPKIFRRNSKEPVFFKRASILQKSQYSSKEPVFIKRASILQNSQYSSKESTKEPVSNNPSKNL